MQTNDLKPILINIFKIFIIDLFYVSLFAFLLYFVVEASVPGLVTDYFNINILLTMALSSGAIMAFIL